MFDGVLCLISNISNKCVNYMNVFCFRFIYCKDINNIMWLNILKS